MSWTLTGPGPNPLARACDEAVCLPGDPATVQETHLAALRMLCRAVDASVRAAEQAAVPPALPARRRRRPTR